MKINVALPDNQLNRDHIPKMISTDESDLKSKIKVSVHGLMHPFSITSIVAETTKLIWKRVRVALVAKNEKACTGISKSTNPRFQEYKRIKSCVLLPAAGRRTQLFHLIFTEPGVCGFAYPCSPNPNADTSAVTTNNAEDRQSEKEVLIVNREKQHDINSLHQSACRAQWRKVSSTSLILKVSCCVSFSSMSTSSGAESTDFALRWRKLKLTPIALLPAAL